MASGTPLKRIFNEAGELTHKECRKCDQMLPINNFYHKYTSTRYQHDKSNNRCIPCQKIQWHEQAKNPESRKRWLLSRIRTKCKKERLPFDLTIEDLAIPTHCPIFGIPLAFGVKTPSSYREKKGQVTVPDDSPSVDRIVPELGYVKGNIVIVSYRANLIKTNASVTELIKVAEFYKMLTS